MAIQDIATSKSAIDFAANVIGGAVDVAQAASAGAKDIAKGASGGAKDIAIATKDGALDVVSGAIDALIDVGDILNVKCDSTHGDDSKQEDHTEEDTKDWEEKAVDVARNYSLSDDVYVNHILQRHGPESTYKNKSHFNPDFDIKAGIDSTLRGDNPTVNPNTNDRPGYIFLQTFSEPIGINSKGKPLYTIKVVIDEDGNVITAFPQK